MSKKASPIDWIALWVFIAGVWPVADPGHSADSLLSMLDLALHGAALLLLISRWELRLARRSLEGP